MKIRSEKLNPFWIDVQPDQFVLIEDKVIQEGDNKGGIHEQTIGYFVDIPGCIKRVIREKFSEEDIVVSLKQFLTMYKELQDKLLEQTNEYILESKTD